MCVVHQRRLHMLDGPQLPLPWRALAGIIVIDHMNRRNPYFLCLLPLLITVAAPQHITLSTNAATITVTGIPPPRHLRRPLARENTGRKTESGLDITVCRHSYLLLLWLTLSQDPNQHNRITVR